MRARQVATVCAVLGLVIFAVGGVWAMVSPHSFFTQVATYPPYNPHLFHDVGAFQLGIAAALAAGLVGRSGLSVALWAGAVGASAHAASHWLDSDLGGSSHDPVLITVLACIPVIGLVAAEATGRPHRRRVPTRRAADAP